MGNCTSQSDRAAKAHSDAIDRDIENDSKKFRKECKILLLGEFAFPLNVRDDPRERVEPRQALGNEGTIVGETIHEDRIGSRAILVAIYLPQLWGQSNGRFTLVYYSSLPMLTPFLQAQANQANRPSSNR